jgi:FKBP-type peptidyl-prolyl cis-trans isomerase FkpA
MLMMTTSGEGAPRRQDERARGPSTLSSMGPPRGGEHRTDPARGLGGWPAEVSAGATPRVILRPTALAGEGGGLQSGPAPEAAMIPPLDPLPTEFPSMRFRSSLPAWAGALAVVLAVASAPAAAQSAASAPAKKAAPAKKPVAKAAKKPASVASATAAAASAAEPVTTESGLVYRSLREGTGPSPEATDVVRVNYRGTFLDGREFDSSYKRGEPAEFPLNRVIRCWTEGVAKMKVGGKAQLTCPAAIAYGARGAGNGLIPPDTTLMFDVELLAIKGR